MGVLENVKRYDEALAKVKNHCMCAKISIDPQKTIITYPEGDFPVDGVRVNTSAHGFEQALDIMERHWKGFKWREQNVT